MTSSLALAVDLGGSHVTCAVVRDKQLLGKSLIPIGLPTDGEHFPELLDLISDKLKRLCNKVGIESSDTSGMVFGFPGIVDARGERVIATDQKFNHAIQFDFSSWCRRALNTGILLENDARLALMGEQYCGAASNCQDVVLITLGTGIGTAAILNGVPLRGNSGRAGSLGGHLPVVLNGRVCSCGNLGCAEAEASTWALGPIVKATPGYEKSALFSQSRIDFAALFECLDHGDPVAVSVLERCYAVWSTLAVALIHAYSPQKLLFGGGVMARGHEILPIVRQYVSRHAWCVDDLTIEAATLGSEAALYGAIPRLREAQC